MNTKSSTRPSGEQGNDPDFLNTLGERLFDVIDQALPTFAFTANRRGRWVSRIHIDGESSTEEASTIYPYNPLWIQDFARGVKSVIWAVVDIEHKAETYADAVAYLCGFAGLDAPKLTEEQRARIISTRRLNEAQKAYKDALTQTDTSKDAQAVRDYLVRRGWSVPDILCSGLGFVTETTRALLYTEEEAAKIATDPKHPMHYVGKYYTLAIPVWTGGNVRTFKFRNIFATEKKNRYRGLADKQRTTLGCLPLRGQADTVIVVEGELDALHDLAIWRQMGEDEKRPSHIPVVSTGMGAVTPKMAEDAVRRGVTYFILAFDQDEHKETHTTSSARNIHAAGGVALVVDYPDGYKDLDEMYCDLVETEGGKKKPRYSVYDTQQMAETATPYAFWVAQRLLAPAMEGKDLGELDSYKIRRRIGRAIAETPYEERPLVVRAIDALNIQGLDAQGLARETAEETQKKARISTLRRAADSLAKGDDIGAEKALQRLETLNNGDEQEGRLQALFEAEQSQEYIYSLCPETERIPLNFEVYANERKYQAFVQTSAVTVFAGKSGHGKTTAEMNVTISALDSLSDGQCVLVFSCEKDLRYIFDRLSSVYAGRKGVELAEAQATISAHQKACRLRLYQLDDLGEIADMVAKEATRTTIKAIVIDYVQILRLRGFRGDKKQRMEQVCLDLRTLSLQYHAAVIVGAQLNRETPNPLDFSSDNIGDAVDIDQLASETYLLWNSAEKPLAPKGLSVEDAVNAANYEFAKRRLNMKLGRAGAMYVQVAKTKRADILPKYAEAALAMDAGGAMLPMQRLEAQGISPQKTAAKSNKKFKSDNTLI